MVEQVSVLFDPLPIARIGYEKATTNVVVGADFSSMAYMLEEYISHGATSLTVSSSSPEASLLSKMPRILADRVRVADDTAALTASARILYHLRQEIGASFNEEAGTIDFPLGTPNEVRALVEDCHNDVRRLAFGFVHRVHVEVDPKLSINRFRTLRSKCRDSQARAILAHLEGLLHCYEDLSFDGVKPLPSSPTQAVSIFDQLVNDASYVGYSTAVAQLGPREYRDRALADIRRYGRALRENRFLNAGWLLVSRCVNAFTGANLPDSKELRDVFPDRSLPPLLDLREARQKAIDQWRTAGASAAPLNAAGETLAEGSVEWLPPCPSLKVPPAGSRETQFGTVGELLAILNALPPEVRELG